MVPRLTKYSIPAVLASVGVLLLFPLFMKPYMIDVMVGILLFAFLSNAWNIIGGYAGQLSLGHATFFGIGAYTSTCLFVNFGLPPLAGMFVGAILGGLAGFILGFLCFRYGLKAAYFALATLAFAEIARIIAYNWKAIGSSLGILIPLGKSSLINLTFTDKYAYYYVILVMAALSLGIVYLIDRSKMGLYLLAIREDEEAAEAAGVDTTKYKLLAITLSAALTATGGTFYAQYLMYISPEEVFGIGISIEIILRPIIGGAGTLFGPIIGAFTLGPLAELARVHLGGYSGVHLAAYGLIVILVVLFLPEGIGPQIVSFVKRLTGKGNKRYGISSEN
jgi:branched-chain amino acid transport system permease protein